MLKRRAVSAYLRRTYDEKRKRAPVRSCGRPERIVRRRDERGERACSLFCRSTLIYCRRYFLVGASWRLPHHPRPTMAGSLDILFRIIARARAAGPFYFAAPTAPPPSATMLYFILLYFYSVLPVCVFFCRVIFRQPLALCCAVAGRRRVSARISRLS